MTRYFLICILIFYASCAESQIKLNVNSQTQTRLDQALKNLVDQLHHFATPKQSPLYLQLKVDQAAKCLSLMRQQLSRYNNVIVGQNNEVNGSQNIIVGNYNSITGSDNFVFIDNFKGEINGSLLLGKWKIQLSKKQFIRINPSWAIFFITQEDNKRYEKYLKRNEWGTGSGMSKATISVFKEIKEEIKNDIQKGFMNLSKPASILNGQAFLSNTYQAPSLNFEGNKLFNPLILPTTGVINNFNQQFSSFAPSLQLPSFNYNQQFMNTNPFSFSLNNFNTEFMSTQTSIQMPTQTSIQMPNILTASIQMPSIQNSILNLNLGPQLQMNKGNNINYGTDLSLSTNKDSLKTASSVIIGPAQNAIKTILQQTKNNSSDKSTDKSIQNKTLSLQNKTLTVNVQKPVTNLRVQDKNPSNSINPINTNNTELRKDIGPKYLRTNQLPIIVNQNPLQLNMTLPPSLGLSPSLGVPLSLVLPQASTLPPSLGANKGLNILPTNAFLKGPVFN